MFLGRMRTLVVALSLLLLPAAAADARAGKAARHARATVAACDADAHTAVFRGAIRAFGKATSLQMRFTLQARATHRGAFKRVAAPTFGEWVTSSPGKKGFVYDKTVQALTPGTGYRALVRFRWRAADGHVIARFRKATRACEQPDDRPNLRATKVAVRPGTSAGTRSYIVRVADKGRTDAAAFSTGLTVNGTALRPVPGGPLAAGATTAVAFVGPRCRAGSTLVAIVDTGDAVDERNETDNRLAVPCPSKTRRNARSRP